MSVFIKAPPTTRRYVFSRPATAHPDLPVHLSLVTNYHKARRDDSGKFLGFEPRENVEWIGSFATQELAEGARVRHQEERNTNNYDITSHVE